MTCPVRHSAGRRHAARACAEEKGAGEVLKADEVVPLENAQVRRDAPCTAAAPRPSAKSTCPFLVHNNQSSGPRCKVQSLPHS